MATDDSSSLPEPPKGWLHPSYSHRTLRAWQRESNLLPFHLMYPVFVCDDTNQKQKIDSLPEQYRWSVDRLDELIAPLIKKGLSSVLLFGVFTDDTPGCLDSLKDAEGSPALSDRSPVVRAIKHLRRTYPTLYIAADVCLCAYTNHGHCGMLDDEGYIDNARSIRRIAQVAVHYARAGAHMVAPSDMMDGRTKAIKAALYSEGYAARCAVMSYAVKYCSSFYGPFRDACHSAPKDDSNDNSSNDSSSHTESSVSVPQQKVAMSDRSMYQLPMASRGLGLAAAKRCIGEGADLIMVKPGMPYLDLLRDVSELDATVPLAVYQVSGEYAMLWHAAQQGALNLRDSVMESCIAFRRAGATVIISYYTPRLLDWLAHSAKL